MGPYRDLRGVLADLHVRDPGGRPRLDGGRERHVLHVRRQLPDSSIHSHLLRLHFVSELSGDGRHSRDFVGRANYLRGGEDRCDLGRQSLNILRFREELCLWREVDDVFVDSARRFFIVNIRELNVQLVC